MRRPGTDVTTLGCEGGFTLVEILVATAIAAVGFLGLAATHVIAVRATAVGRNVSTATALATRNIETMRRQSYDALATTSATSESVGGLSFSEAATVANAPVTNSKMVTETVNWSDEFGAHNVQLITVISK